MTTVTMPALTGMATDAAFVAIAAACGVPAPDTDARRSWVDTIVGHG